MACAYSTCKGVWTCEYIYLLIIFWLQTLLTVAFGFRRQKYDLLNPSPIYILGMLGACICARPATGCLLHGKRNMFIWKWIQSLARQGCTAVAHLRLHTLLTLLGWCFPISSCCYFAEVFNRSCILLIAWGDWIAWATGTRGMVIKFQWRSGLCVRPFISGRWWWPSV